MKTPIKFRSKTGQKLSGVLHTSDVKETIAYALFAHCFTCTKNINAAANIVQTLADNGIATLRFDFAGLGASEGEFSETNFTTNIEDLISAAAFLTKNYRSPQILIGHSLGGTAVMAAAQHLPFVQAVATIGAPASPAHVLHVLEDHLAVLEQEGEAVVPLAGRPHTFKQNFVDDVMAHMVDVSLLKKALMVMHAPFDTIVSIHEATKIFSHAKHPKNFVSLDQADHLLSRKQDAIFAGEVIANWAKYYVTPETTSVNTDADKTIVVTGHTNQAYFNVAQAGKHRFVIDEPLSYGGTDLGPTPYDYLGVALASCTSMTLNGYARRKNLNVTKVSVRVEHDRIHAEDCTHCVKTKGKVDQFIRHIRIDGDITEEQRNRMLEIADLCPVHKTLENEISVKTRLEPRAHL